MDDLQVADLTSPPEGATEFLAELKYSESSDFLIICLFVLCVGITMVSAILLYYVLTDPDYCKKIALYLAVFARILNHWKFIKSTNFICYHNIVM